MSFVCGVDENKDIVSIEAVSTGSNDRQSHIFSLGQTGSPGGRFQRNGTAEFNRSKHISGIEIIIQRPAQMYQFFQIQTLGIGFFKFAGIKSAQLLTCHKLICHLGKIGGVGTMAVRIIIQTGILHSAAVNSLKCGNLSVKSPTPDVSVIKKIQPGFGNLFRAERHARQFFAEFFVNRTEPFGQPARRIIQCVSVTFVKTAIALNSHQLIVVDRS